MLERLIIATALLSLVLVVTAVVRAVIRRRLAAAQGQLLPEPLRARLPSHAPGIVYFFGPRCAACRQQARVLDQLSAATGARVVAIDAVGEQALADALAVTAVPATVIVDAGHVVRAINLGFRPLDVLEAQLS